MNKFENDGTWRYVGSINGDRMFVKSHYCTYVDCDGYIVQSPEEREIIRQANERLKIVSDK
jgi:hypothetical protein